MGAIRRIVFVVPDCGDGGLFQFYNQLIPSLAKHAKVHVLFASMFDNHLAPAIPNSTAEMIRPDSAVELRNALAAGPLAVAPQLLRALGTAHLAWKRALELDPDIIEVCDWPLGMAPAVLDPSVPSVIQCHGSMAQISQFDPQSGGSVESMILRLIEPQVISHALEVQTYSRANAQSWEAATARAVRVIRPAFRSAGYRPSATDAGASFSIFGRLQSWKGPQVLCAALQLLGPRAPVCDWYGSAKPWPDSNIGTDQYLAGTYPRIWGKTFRFHAPVDRFTVARLQGASRAAIVPSTWDVFNFTALEAMAMARPLIVSTGAGASELIEDGVNGFTFDNGDAAALAQAIERLLSQTPAQTRSMGEAAYETVRQQLDPDKIAAQRMHAYREVMARHAAAPPRPVSPWLADLLTPGRDTGFDMSSFLDTLPARPMMQSVSKRLRAKLRSGI